MASGISNTFRIGGLAMGVAGLGAVFQHRLATSLDASLGGAQGGLAKAVASGGTRAAATFAHGRHGVVEASLRAFSALAGIALVRTRDFHRRPTPEPAAETLEAARA